LIKIADFIDAFDHEHSSLGAVLFRRETRRHWSCGAQYPLRNPTPAVSGQIAKLEESLRGTKLFQRRPFALSPAGVELFEFNQTVLRQHRDRQCKATSEQVAAIAHSRAVDRAARLCPGAVAKTSRQISRSFGFTCTKRRAREAERLLLARDVDLAITVIEKKLRAGIQVQPLLELPLILLVHKKSRLARAEELWKHDKIEETLITFPRSDPIHASFQRGLEGLEWNGFAESRSLGSFDRALRRERLWDWLGSGGPRFQARRRRARFAVAGFSPGRCRRVVVRQAFEYFKAIARRAGSRSPGATRRMKSGNRH